MSQYRPEGQSQSQSTPQIPKEKGRGAWTCVEGLQCEKGGVDANGELFIFTRACDLK